MATTESVAKTICDKDFKTTSCDNLWQTSFKQQADWFNRLECNLGPEEDATSIYPKLNSSSSI